jgi:aminomethyltransferase
LITKFTKEFTNSENLKKKEAGVTRKLVAFEMQERAVPRHDYEIVDASELLSDCDFGNHVTFYE